MMKPVFLVKYDDDTSEIILSEHNKSSYTISNSGALEFHSTISVIPFLSISKWKSVAEYEWAEKVNDYYDPYDPDVGEPQRCDAKSPHGSAGCMFDMGHKGSHGNRGGKWKNE